MKPETFPGIKRIQDFTAVVCLLGLVLTGPSAVADPVPRTAFVHLFEWRWDDIARECETFLGPKGFAAVQVSPPNEHRVVPSFPWWERYQPVSYQLSSRSGDRQQFEDMVKRCKAAGVKIYVDAVINHMTGPRFDNDPLFGTGSGGSGFDYYRYPPYPAQDAFHGCRQKIEPSDYRNKGRVQNCNLEKLADLDTGSDAVRNAIAAYLNDLISLGVAGFRIDAAKHIDTNDIHAILSKVQGNPEIYQEVIEAADEAVQGPEYFQNGQVIEFDYGRKLAEFFRGGRLAQLRTLGDTWQELMPSAKAVVFVDNHDKQRGHGGGGDYITHKDGRLYDLANVFMLAWPYGYPQVMSSYAFTNTDAGPPSDGQGHTRPIYQGDQPSCFSEWQCEHRWRAIANMVAYRNYTLPAWHVDNWWDNGANQIAFSRGYLGFLVINKESGPLERTFQTGLPAGRYCNAWDGEPAGNACTGTTIAVNTDGSATIKVEPWTAAAIHVGAKLDGQPPVDEWRRTVVLVQGQTLPGQDMFIRGGIDHDYAKNRLGRDCSATNHLCAIPIRHRNLKNPTTSPWKQGDTTLDWYGREAGQQTVSHGILAEGTPLDWTTDRWPADWGEKRTVALHGFGEEPLNTYGLHYWMLDVDMDCSQTAGGWFELKSYISGGPGWEGDVTQPGAPYASRNHFARCGHLNVFQRGKDAAVALTPLP